MIFFALSRMRLYPRQQRGYTARQGFQPSSRPHKQRLSASSPSPQNANSAGFPEKNQEKPQKSCGNQAFFVDSRRRKPQG
jgi:hypothetical protein